MKMNEKRTGLFENGLIWFGAGVSIAEILTGTYLAPLGMGKGLAAILIGHIIGCLMLFLAGVIGGRVRKSAMETVKMSFGQKGSILFAVLNVLQLVGWTAIMIYDGALAADGVMHTGRWIWCLVIGVLIILWIVIGITNLGKINTVAMAALFLLSLILSKVIFAGGGAGAPSDDSMTFGAAVQDFKEMITEAIRVLKSDTEWAELDLSKYFDTLNHEILMNLLRRNEKDERVVQLIKRYLKSGVMENGVVMEEV